MNAFWFNKPFEGQGSDSIRSTILTSKIMNTAEESAIAHEKEHKAGNADDDVELGRGNEVDHKATGTFLDGSIVHV